MSKNRAMLPLSILLALQAACTSRAGNNETVMLEEPLPARVPATVFPSPFVKELSPEEREARRLRYEENERERAKYSSTQFARCAGCHSLQPGVNGVGPSLAGVFGRKVASLEGYRYSNALAEKDFVWNAATLDVWLESPRGFERGTKMAFAGISRASERAALIAWLERETNQVD